MKTVFQSIKFVLVGGAATLADLAVFDMLIWIIPDAPLIVKTISFIIAILIKYTGNKYWTFKKPELAQLHKEVIPFVIVALIAWGIDLLAFHYATTVIGPQWGISMQVWTQASVIFAAVSSALVSFLGYKFLVFKK